MLTVSLNSLVSVISLILWSYTYGYFVFSGRCSYDHVIAIINGIVGSEPNLANISWMRA